jgi:hypothetical protein
MGNYGDFECLVAAKGSLDAVVQNNQERMEAKMDTHQERMKARMEDWQKEIMACLGKMVACRNRKEPTPVEMANVVAQLEDSNGVTHEETVRATDSQSRDWHIAVGCCQHLKNGGPQ